MKKDDELDQILTEYDADELRVASGANGIRVYHDQGRSSIGDELLWSWYPEDDEPYPMLYTLFDQLGVGVSW